MTLPGAQRRALDDLVDWSARMDRSSDASGIMVTDRREAVQYLRWCKSHRIADPYDELTVLVWWAWKHCTPTGACTHPDQTRYGKKQTTTTRRPAALAAALEAEPPAPPPAD